MKDAVGPLTAVSDADIEQEITRRKQAKRKANRRQRILNIAEDLPTNVLFYNRKEDDDLPVGAIEKAVRSGLVTVEEIIGPLRNALVEHAPRDEAESLASGSSFSRLEVNSSTSSRGGPDGHGR